MLSRERIKQILVEQRKAILNKPFGIKREAISIYAKKKKLPHAVVVTGIRRVGKSTFLRQIIKEYYSDKNFYYINFEDERLLHFDAQLFNELYEVLIELYGEQKTFFIDEIQNVKNFESFVRRFYEQGFKFIITGSNANLLSRELGTKLTGRYININIKPFSFNEYLKFAKVKLNTEALYQTEHIANLKKHFNKYLLTGGMPEYLKYKDPEILTRTYEDIIIKDIAVRYKIDNLYEMRELYQYLVSNFAMKFSFTTLKNIMHLGSVNTVKKYISFLEESFFFTVVNKYDASVKKQIVNEKKIFVLDNGFIPFISNKVNNDNGWLLENLVFNVLSNYDKVFYYSRKNECDFVLHRKNKIIMAVQVCWELTKGNEKREYKGLIAAMEEFGLKTGMIITSNQEKQITHEGYKIEIKPAWKWLLTFHPKSFSNE